MKKVIIFLGLYLIFAFAATAQCEKNITFVSNKTEFHDANGALQRTQDGSVTIKMTQKHIAFTVKAENNTDLIEGDIENLICSWKEPFKSGKSTFRSLLTKSDGETKNASITIEGKDGKLSVTLELENMNGLKMYLPIDSYKINP